jgi:hypothetical protein
MVIFYQRCIWMIIAAYFIGIMSKETNIHTEVGKNGLNFKQI